MSRVVRGGLIQATLCEPATSPVAAVKKAMIDKHVALIAEAAERRSAGRLPAGAVLRSVLLRRAAIAVVRADRARSRRPDHQADVRTRQEARDRAGRAGLRGRPHRRLLQHGRRDRRRRHATSASSARCTSRTARRASGRSSISGPATSAIRSSRPASARSAFTSATTAISPKGRAAWA